MGMDPIGANETLELVFEVHGDGKKVKRSNFKLFQVEIENFLEACKNLDAGDGSKIRVRVHRSGVRKKLDD